MPANNLMRLSYIPADVNRQRGAALMVMLVIMVVGAATFLVSSFSNSGLQIMRDQQTAVALAQAKDALLGYAASDTTRPGELPCPDFNNDGKIVITDDYNGSACKTLLGRLPWKTLGLPNLRDAAGETLWYAVSDPFHANASDVLNSDTAGTLSVSGNLSASGVVAIVFAPGAPLSGQDRSTANENSYDHYLESIVTAYTTFKLDTADNVPGGGYSYNDQMTLITHDNLFQVVEKAVASHIKNSDMVKSYSDAWGTLPFATAAKETYGLLNADTPYWSFIQETGDGSATCTRRPSSCSGSACTFARCSSYTGLSAGDVIVITGTIENVGMGFWRLYNPTTGSSSTSSCSQEVCVRLASDSKYYPASSVMDNVSIVGSLDSNGRATITFTGTVKSGFIPNRIQFSSGVMPDYASTLLSWFSGNNWQDVIYYAVSPGYIYGAGNACNSWSGGTPPYCLKLGNNEDIPAVFIMTGSELTGQSHATAIISNYLEGKNASPTNYEHENKARDSAFNDYVITVTP